MDGHVTDIGGETSIALQGVQEFARDRSGDRVDAIAPSADKVDVHVIIHGVVRRGAVTEVRMRHQADLLEHLERAVDGREIDLRRLSLHAHEDLLGGCVAEVIDRNEHKIALWCHAISPGVEAPVHIGGHALG